MELKYDYCPFARCPSAVNVSCWGVDVFAAKTVVFNHML
jgi:hypothetical protein